MLLVLLLTVSAGTLVSSNKVEPCPDTARLACGKGKETYNPLTDICCQGKISPLANMTHPECCAQKAYDRSTHLCCRHNSQAKVTYISKMAQPQCCGIEAFDVTKEKCCSAGVKESMPIVYQPMKQSCKHEAKVDRLCKWVLYDMDTAECGCDKSYDPKKQKCCPGNVVVNIPANTTNPHCCGKTVYNQHTHRCCNGLIYDISGTVQPLCCGPKGTFYDQSTELCCDGEKKYFHGLASPACCGKEAFDAETHSCVDGKVTVKKAEPKKTPAPVVCRKKGIYDFTYQTKSFVKSVSSAEACDNYCVQLADCYSWSIVLLSSGKLCYTFKKGAALKIATDGIAGTKGCTQDGSG